ncbi:unnamed protein product [Schistocephalus solidus]|uniref:Uncharacterized protein n=1 Tax=Schistocephalus solidus TaxID=70667 RepID=A0A183TB87_SCHSO|nr:unnamed protein product [Schistocephalus solidus]
MPITVPAPPGVEHTVNLVEIDGRIVDAQSKIVAGGSKDVHAPLHVPFYLCIECAVFSEEVLVDGGCGHTRVKKHQPLVEESAIHPVGYAAPRRSSRQASISTAENMRLRRVGTRAQTCFTPLVTVKASDTARLSVTCAIMPSWS